MAPDSGVRPADGAEGSATSDAKGSAGAECGLYLQLLANMPPQVSFSFTAEQRSALANAARHCGWGRHQTDIRLSIPLLFRRYYLVLLAGEERRSNQRRQQDRSAHPFITGGNLLFLGASVTLATILGSLIWTVGFVWYLSG